MSDNDEIPFGVSIKSIEVKPDTFYIVNVHTGNMSPAKSRKYIDGIKESGAFAPLKAHGGNYVLAAYQGDKPALTMDTLSERQMNDLGWVKDPNHLTEEIWNDYIAEKLPHTHVHYSILKTLLDNQLAYHNTFGFGFKNWRMIIDMVIATVTKSVLFKTIDVQPMVAPVGVATQDDGGTFPLEAKTRKAQAKWTMEMTKNTDKLHGFDINIDIGNALSSEFAYEIDALLETDIKIFCPYVLVMPSPPVMDMETYAPIINFMMRYSTVEKDAKPVYDVVSEEKLTK